jgi:hypothetical protein
MDKITLMHVAAQLTGAVAGNFPDNLPVDADIADPALRGMNLAVWEEFRIFYRALVNAVQDETSWPSPEVPGGKMIPNLLGNLGPAFQGILGSPIVQEILRKLIGVMPLPA